MPQVQRLARFGDLSHQDRRCVQIPIRVGDMRMSEIGAQGDDMASNRIPVVATSLQGSDREGMP